MNDVVQRCGTAPCPCSLIHELMHRLCYITVLKMYSARLNAQRRPLRSSRRVRREANTNTCCEGRSTCENVYYIGLLCLSVNVLLRTSAHTNPSTSDLRSACLLNGIIAHCTVLTAYCLLFLNQLSFLRAEETWIMLAESNIYLAFSDYKFVINWIKKMRHTVDTL